MWCHIGALVPMHAMSTPACMEPNEATLILFVLVQQWYADHMRLLATMKGPQANPKPNHQHYPYSYLRSRVSISRLTQVTYVAMQF